MSSGSKVGGVRKGAGRKPRTGVKRNIAKTVMLTPAELAATKAAAGKTPWSAWAGDALVAAAGGNNEKLFNPDALVAARGDNEKLFDPDASSVLSTNGD